MSIIRNIIKSQVNRLLEDKKLGDVLFGSPDGTGKHVTKNTDSFHIANAMDSINDIDQKFRELGISVNPNELSTIDILKSQQPFKMSFKLPKPTSFFNGDVQVSGMARIDDRIKKDLRIFFTSDGDEKVRIDFDRKTLLSKQPQTGGEVNALMEKTTYLVKISHSKSDVEVGKIELTINGKTKTFSGSDPITKRLSNIYYYTSKNGDDYLVSPNPDKKNGGKKGYKNVTVVQLWDGDPMPNKSFVVKNDLLEKIPNEFHGKKIPTQYAYFPNNGGRPIPAVIKKQNRPQTTKIIITSLPEIGLVSGDSGDNKKFQLGQTVKIKGEISVDGGKKLNLVNGVTLDEINDALVDGVYGELSQSKQNQKVIKLTIKSDFVVMLRPLKSSPDPYFVSNWKNLPVEIGQKALGNENWDNTNGVATLKIVK